MTQEITHLTIREFATQVNRSVAAIRKEVHRGILPATLDESGPVPFYLIPIEEVQVYQAPARGRPPGSPNKPKPAAPQQGD